VIRLTELLQRWFKKELVQVEVREAQCIIIIPRIISMEAMVLLAHRYQ
jgi:hypothetical protein